MTRIQAVNKIAAKQVEEYVENTDKLHRVIVTGNIGLVESSNTELEELHKELFNTEIKIK